MDEIGVLATTRRQALPRLGRDEARTGLADDSKLTPVYDRGGRYLPMYVGPVGTAGLRRPSY